MKILITGAGSGIGKSIAIELSRDEGNEILLIDSCEESKLLEIGSSCRAFGASVYTYCVDITDKIRFKNICNDVSATFGALDMIFVNAGIMSADDQNNSVRLMEVNYFAAVNTVQEFLPSMFKEKKGRIIFSNSIASLVTTLNSGDYSASKAALDAYADSLRLKLRGHGITVTTAIIGFVDTPMIKGIRHAQLLAVSSELTASVIIRSAMRGKSKVSVPALRNSIWYILRYIRTPTRNRIESIIERCFAFVLKQPADR
jgi:NAD(P)-dependent dehydrogenase (short-subunit alcohol dehydrogenase family)